MAYYAYKQVRDLLPQHIIDAQGPDYEGDANYDGDQWDAAADYIAELKETVAKQDALLRQALEALEKVYMECEVHSDDGETAMIKASNAIRELEEHLK